MSDTILIYAEDFRDGSTRLLGQVLTDSPNRAVQMYQDDCEWFEEIVWEWQS